MPRRCLTFMALSFLLAGGTASSGEHTWTGRVVDAEGRPLPGVEIWAAPQAQPRHAERRPATISGPDGLFTVPIAWGTMTICPAGWAAAEHRPSSSHSGEPVEIRLERVIRMAGRVVDGQGEPVPGMDVMAQFAGGGWSTGCVILSPPEPCLGHPKHRSGRTDAEGRFVFEGLKPGWFVVTAVNGTRPETVRWQGTAGEGGREVEIVLPWKLVPLEGRVVDAEGKPVEGAQVMISGVQPPVPAQTDATGAFRFPRAAPGPHLLQVSHPDIGWLEKEIPVEGSPARLDVRMPRSSLVQGRITGRDGSPVVRPMMSVDSRHVEVDPEGRFRLHIETGEHVVRVNAPNRVPVEKTITATGDPIGLNLEMSRPATVLGRVTGLLPDERRSVKLKEARSAGASPDEEGRFRIQMVAPRTWTLVASDANGRTVQRRIQVEEGREVTVEDLSFPPLPEVRGLVLGPDGLPARYATMSFLKGDLTVWVGTDSKGRFKAHLVDGTWTVKAEMKGLGPAATTVTMAGAPLEIPDLRLVRPVTLSGYIRGLAPGEVPFVQARNEDGLWTRGSNAEQDFRFQIPELWPGTWTLTAFIGERKTSTQVRILPGDTAVRADVSFEED